MLKNTLSYSLFILINCEFYLETPSGPIFSLLLGKIENYYSKEQISYVKTKQYFEVPVLNITHNFLLVLMEKTKISKGFYEGRSAFVFLNCSLVTEYMKDGLSQRSSSALILLLISDYANTAK